LDEIKFIVLEVCWKKVWPEKCMNAVGSGNSRRKYKLLALAHQSSRRVFADL
jgi:hypothetical protein